MYLDYRVAYWTLALMGNSEALTVFLTTDREEASEGSQPGNPEGTPW